MTGWVDSISTADERNWAICKRERLWATPSNAGGAHVGDDVFLWKPLPNSGWLAHCRVTTTPRRVRPGERLPWPDDRDYRWVMGIEVVSEPAEPLQSRGADAAATAGLAHHVKLGQFGRMSDEGVVRLSALLAGPSSIEQALEELLAATGAEPPPETDQRDYARRLIALRRGQRAFRQGLLRAFEGACCISGSRVEAVLEAAHIRPYLGAGSHAAGNGLLLRADLHTLFDLHLITVLPIGTVRTAPDLRGSDYEDYDERLIRRPSDPSHRPNAQALEEHNAACLWLS